ncbi:hypothetical protein HRR80_000289 [Exophiala dermatitidis]|uniref:Uncharacterized protein n=1 Tax=Exophiala dermatitidis TaxID=5970 RepID=A0AAN6J2J4_EXODE|nr:hypothetical protein HRR82_000375 [Exophiala dermatitidis]KAJ4621065.1 hypothetical protein HRR85_001285 [Exophiala dermatitidis]KAJ8995521.1 hypothetical protein HRR80_000289 [Exophiala dermatitidis]
MLEAKGPKGESVRKTKTTFPTYGQKSARETSIRSLRGCETRPAHLATDAVAILEEMIWPYMLYVRQQSFSIVSGRSVSPMLSIWELNSHKKSNRFERRNPELAMLPIALPQCMLVCSNVG